MTHLVFAVGARLAGVQHAAEALRAASPLGGEAQHPLLARGLHTPTVMPRLCLIYASLCLVMASN